MPNYQPAIDRLKFSLSKIEEKITEADERIANANDAISEAKHIRNELMLQRESVIDAIDLLES